ncbi:enoyl-CoA hydratase-related protein [Azospirillum sp. TSO22-1]|uniref:enoyl-CoA hydratase/isomerase family protein n=1 Tax=Azospirillum sp. TSO22-1 TaxID=716789 RepID=UPI000D61A619|nr:enoyl-CoA hydratase-related protein [Azospirillum sp. TSO22-1]PWC43500.1 enoyl-CoA hydratase [Azospirillum sp. TSO22-1]
MAGTVTVERDGVVATVLLSNPGRLNAFDKPQWLALRDAMTELSADGAVRIIVLRGAGGAFSPGADISEFESERGSPEQAMAYGELMDAVMFQIRDCPTPTLAAIDGPCTGIGLAVALACDLRVCTESSRFGVPVSRLGISMALPELKLLFDVVGRPFALEILLEGRVFAAGLAREMRLVNRVVADGELDAEVAATARRIADGAPLAARWHKAFVGRAADPAPLTDAELAECYKCFGTEDYREGYRAFLEKRKPVFGGR